MSTIEMDDMELSEREERALTVIEDSGGIYQSEFWKAMDVSSRTGSRIISKLLEKGLVEREGTVYEGRTTYYVEVVHTDAELDFSLLMAGDEISPFIGEEVVDSQNSAFSEWIMQLAYEDANSE